MKKLFLILLIIFCVVSCELKKAQEAYDKKEYIESMKIVLDYFDKNPNKLSKLKPDIKNDLMEKFSNIVNYYEQMVYGNSNEKIKGYSGLGQVYMLLDSHSSSQKFTDFLEKHNLNSIYENYESLIAQEVKKQISGKNYGIAEETIELSYNRHIEFTEKIMNGTFESGKKEIYRELNRILAKGKTDKLLDIAQEYEKLKYYRKAQDLYLEASNTYSEYDSNYKQAKNKYAETKHEADLADAQRNYEYAISLTKKGTKLSYRQSVDYFKKASKYVFNYEDSNNLAEKYKSMGYVNYYVSGCPDSVENSINSKLSGIGKTAMSTSSADVVILCDISTSYDVNSLLPSHQRRYEKIESEDSSGNTITKEYSFDEIRKALTETLELRYKITLSGMTSKTFSGKTKLTNETEDIQFRGDVPDKFQPKKANILGEYEMKKEAYNELGSKLSNEINDIGRIVSDL